MMLAPIHLKFALVFLTSGDPGEELGREHFNSPMGIEVRKWLYENDLIDQDGYRTERLSVWVEHLLLQPLPVQRWIIPTGDAP